jgi:hypothetical protein
MSIFKADYEFKLQIKSILMSKSAFHKTVENNRIHVKPIKYLPSGLGRETYITIDNGGNNKY